MSFAKLLRRSKLAAFDTNASKLSTPIQPACDKTGDYGLKYNVPAQSRFENIRAKEIDNGYNFFRFQNASSDGLRFEVLRELFGKIGANSNAASETRRASDDSAADVTVDDLKKLQAEFLESTKDQPELRRDMNYCNEFVNARLSEGALKKKSHNLEYAAPSRQFQSSEKLQDTDSLYTKVKGRILGETQDGFTIGVGGIVGFLPKSFPYFRPIPGWDPRDRRQVYDFYVEELSFDDDGRPDLRLTMSRPSGRTLTAKPVEQTKTAPSNADDDNLLSSLLSQMKSSSSPRSKKVDESVNKDAADVMSKLSDIIKDIQGSRKQ